MVDIANLQVVVGADTSEAEKGLSSLSGKVQSVGGAINAAFTGAAVAGVAGLAAGFAGAVTAASGFESTMSGVKAVSGATADEMSQLSALALKLGADTSFSASEAGKGIEELVKGGLSIPDIMNGAAEATLNLAAAGGVSLPDAATIAANALAQFNLKGEDMAHVADLIAGAANASALDVGDFKFSLQAAGAVASTVGFNFDDLAEAIAVMGKAGITGSDAGTSLKTMMMNLQPTTKEQKKLFRELGLETTNLQAGLEAMRAKGIEPQGNDWTAFNNAIADYLGYSRDSSTYTKEQSAEFERLYRQTGAVGSAFFDANGKVKSMAEVAQVLQNATAGMTEAQRLSTLETIFGSDAIRAAAVLAKEGAAGFNEMAAAMGNVTAAEVGAERLNNLSGSFEQLKGSLETAAITVGMAFLPAIRELVDAVTDAVNGALPSLQAGAETAAAAFTAWLPTIKDLVSTLWENSDVILAVVGALAAFRAAMAISAAITATTTAIGLLTAGLGAGTISASAFWAALGGPVTLVVGAIVAGLALLYVAWNRNWLGIRDATDAVLAFLSGAPETLQAIWDGVTGGMQALWDATGEAWTGIQTAITDTFGPILDGITSTWKEAQEVSDTIHRAIQNVIAGIWEAIYTQAIQPKLDAISTAVSGAWNTVQTTTSTVLTAVLTFVRDTIWTPLQTAVTTAVNAARDAVNAAWTAVDLKAREILTPVLTFVRDTVFEPIRQAVDTAMNAGNGVVQTFTGAVDAVKGVVDGTLASIKAVWESTWRAIQRAAESPQEAMNVLIGLVDKLKSIMPDWLIPHSPTPFQIGLEGIMGAAQKMNRELERFFSGAAGGLGNVTNWLRQAISVAGVGEDWLGPLTRLVEHESSGNPRARNSTAVNGEHASGLLQTLPSTFAAYAAKGHKDIWNPIDNAIAAIRYIEATYGHVRRIPGLFNGEFQGYATGGIAWGPQLAMVGEREPEAIIPRSWFRQAGGAQTIHMPISIGGRVVEDIYVTGRELAIRRGRVPVGAV